MSAARYFGLRNRLAGVMAGVDALAQETGTGPGLAARLDPAAGAWAPRRVLFCGEVNSGKSSLINAWVGATLCPAGPLPVTNRVIHYRHGAARLDVELADGTLEASRPLEFLREVEVTDTPGLNLLEKGGRVLLAALASRHDMVAVVFSHANPWEPSTWEWLERLPEECLERVLLVVQQADRFDEREVPVVLGHLRDLARKRTGRELPVVAVSAAQAAAACRSQPADARMWEASGFGGFAGWFSAHVCGSRRAVAGLREWHTAVAAELRQVEERVDGQSLAVNTEAQFLAWMEAAVDEDRERVSGGLSGRLEGYEGLVRGLRGWLGRRLGVLVSFVRVITGDRTSGELDRALVERVAGVARHQAEADAAGMVAVCRERWETLTPEVTARLGMVMRPFSEIEPVLQEKAARYADRFREAAVAAAADVRAGFQLGPDLRRRLAGLGWWFSVALSFVTAAGITGTMMIAQWPWILLGCTGLVWLGAAMVGWSSRRRLMRDLEELLVTAEEALADRLRRDGVDGIRAFFTDFARQLDPVRRRVARTRFLLMPAVERAGGLFIEVKAVEQEIRKLEDEVA